MASLPTILLILAALSTGVTVIAILVALRSAREARSAIFPIVREEETIRAQRARVAIFIAAAITAVFLGGWLATLSIPEGQDNSLIAAAQPVQTTEAVVVEVATEPPPPATEAVFVVTGEANYAPEPLPTATSVPPTPSPVPTSTPVKVEVTAAPVLVVQVSPTPAAVAALPTAAATATPVPAAVAPTTTPTPLPTTTPTATVLNVVQILAQASRTPAPPGAKIGPIQFATELTPGLEPVNPGDRFPETIQAVYAVYPFTGMENGVNFAAVWYQNGNELYRDERQWQFGGSSRSYSYLNPSGEGLYKLEIYVNDTVLATSLFEIR